MKMMWAESNQWHTWIYWRGRPIYKSHANGLRSWMFDSYGWPWQLPPQDADIYATIWRAACEWEIARHLKAIRAALDELRDTEEATA